MNLRFFNFIAFSVVLIFSVVSASADPIDMFGARAIGMGGAFAGLADDLTCLYYNPAGLSVEQTFAFGSFYGGYYVNGGRFMERYNDLKDVDLDNPDFILNPDDVDEVVRLLKRMDKQTVNLTGNSHYGLAVGSRYFAIGLLEQKISAIEPRLDLTNINALPANDPTSILNNDTRIFMSGLQLTTYYLSAAYPLDTLVIGISTKWIQARSFVTKPHVFDMTDEKATDLIDSAFDRNEKVNDDYDADAGALVRFGGTLIGIMWRNIRQPKFKFEDGRSWRMKDSLNIGLTYREFKSFTIAIDYDILERNTPLVDIPYRNLSVGGEAHIANVMDIRAGFFRNLHRGDVDFEFTFGVGVKYKVLSFDMGMLLSEDIEFKQMAFSMMIQVKPDRKRPSDKFGK